MRLKRILSTFLSCILLLTVLLAWYAIPAEAATHIVPDDYPTIQAAINAASSGDTIEVRNGTYLEQVIVNKTLTLRGDYRNIEHPRNPLITIIDGMGNGTVVELDADSISISGFTMCNSGSGKGFFGILSGEPEEDGGFSGHTIVNNLVTGNDHGIRLPDSDNNYVFNNTVVENSLHGIVLLRTTNNNITGNTIEDSAYGIRLIGATGNYIINNTLKGVSYGIYMADTSPSNTVKYNKLKSETASIYAGGSSYTIIDHNVVLAPGSVGIYLYNSDQCSIVYNVVSGNITFGIRLYSSCDYNDLYNNKILYTRWGVELVSSFYNTFVGNWFQENTYGVYLSGSWSETFYYNNFVDNDVQISPSGANTYDDGGVDLCPICGELQPKGNYWSDYEGEDDGTPSAAHNCAGDGVGDTEVPHYDVGLDWYPLMEPWSEHDVGVVSVELSATSVYVGDTLNITVVVENEGKGGQSETFDVTARYGDDIIETQTVTNLASDSWFGVNTTLIFYWDTTYVEAPFNHTISVEAVAVTDELDTTDNFVVAGEVRVSRRPGPWWYLPGNYMIHVQPGSSRDLGITIGYHAPPGEENMTLANLTTTTVYQLWDRYNISFASPVDGISHLVMPQASFSSRPFYLRPISIGGFTLYTWGQLLLPEDGNGTLATEDGILDVDMFVNVTGYGNGTYSHGKRTIGDGTPDPAGSLMMDMPLKLQVYQGENETDPTWKANLTTIDFPVWLTTGKINVTVDDSAGPFPTGTDSIHGYNASAEGSLLDPYNGSITVVATGGGIDLYYFLFGDLYNDFFFKEVEILALTTTTDATASPNEVLKGEPVFISSTGVNQIYYPENITVTVKAYGPEEITINVTTFENVAPEETITISVTWDTNATGTYTIMVEARSLTKVDGDIVAYTDIWVAGTVFVKISCDFDDDGDIDLTDFYIFAGSYLTIPVANPRCDLDSDGDCDLTDFYIFSGYYLTV